jgi:methyl-accepting chemotaxis protein
LAQRIAKKPPKTHRCSYRKNISNSRAGSQLTVRTDENFSAIQASSRKVGELVGEIAATAGEQSQDINKINKTVGEMDRVTRHTAVPAGSKAGNTERGLLAKEKDKPQKVISLDEASRTSRRAPRGLPALISRG